MKEVDASSLEHTSWRCQYHVVFAPKYRRMEIYGKIKRGHRDYTAEVVPAKERRNHRSTSMPRPHPHVDKHPAEVQRIPDYGIPEREKSSLMIFDRHANLKYKYGNRHFWARGYFVDTVGRNKKAIKAYIQNQLEEDKMSDQISIKEFIDPFTGSTNPKA